MQAASTFQQSSLSMADYQRESHARSLIKGVSWRIVATLDTILVGAVVLYFFNDGHVDIWKVLTIAAAEFPLKYLLYYVHERGWEYVRVDGETARSRTLKKSISWRIFATAMTFLIAAVVLNGGSESADSGHGIAADGVAGVAFAIAIVEFFSKFALYYVHERIWAKLPLGKIRNWLFGKKSD